MNKFFALMLTAVFALTGVTAFSANDTPVSVDTTEEPESVMISGAVLEVAEDSITFTTPDGLTVQAHITADTVQEYDLPGGQLNAGDFVYVMYSGMMTRSLPAQITAEMIRSAVREGEVSEIGEDFFMLRTDAEELQVNCTADQLAGLETGAKVKVYFSGAMTMSLPAQIGADLIVTAE